MRMFYILDQCNASEPWAAVADEQDRRSEKELSDTMDLGDRYQWDQGLRMCY